METTITICGWVLFGLLPPAMFAFAVAIIYGCAFLGYHLSTRFIRERKRWKKAIRESNQQRIMCIMALQLPSHRTEWMARMVDIRPRTFQREAPTI